MKPIAQEHTFGCGAACVAFVLKLSYQNALDIFENGKEKAQNNGFYCKEIVKALTKNDWISEYKYIKPEIKHKIYCNYSMVFIKRSKSYPAGHYLCRYKDLWMDPWINFKENRDVAKAIAGFRKRLPGHPIYAIIPHQKITSK